MKLASVLEAERRLWSQAAGSVHLEGKFTEDPRRIRMRGSKRILRSSVSELLAHEDVVYSLSVITLLLLFLLFFFLLRSG